MLEHLKMLIPSLGKGTSFEELGCAFLKTKRLDMTGLKGGSLAALIASIAESSMAKQSKALVIVENAEKAVSFYRDLTFHHKLKDEVLHYQSYDLGPYDELIPDRRSSMQRAGVLFRLASDMDWRFTIISADALLRKVVPRRTFEELCVPISTGDKIDRDTIVKVLDRGGYNRTPLVEDPGTYAVRGGLIDVFPPYLDFPARVELFGNEVEAVRFFDPVDQNTKSQTNEVWIHPCRLTIAPTLETEKIAASRRIREICDDVDQPTSKTDRLIDDLIEGRLFVGTEGYLPALNKNLDIFLDYLPPNLAIYVDNPTGVRMAWEKTESAYSVDLSRRQERREPAFLLKDHIISPRDLEAKILTHRLIISHPLLLSAKSDSELERLEIPFEVGAFDTGDLSERLRNLTPANENTDLTAPLTTYLQELVENSYRVLLAAHTTGQAERLAVMLRGRGLDVKLTDQTKPDDKPGVSITVGDMSRGFILPKEGAIWICEEEIYGRRSRRASGSTKKKTSSDDLRHLTPGDLVVHKEHGIGRYEGLIRQKVKRSEVDFLLISYRGNDRLYLPVYRLNQVQKYRSDGDRKAGLDKLGGQTFSKTKAKARKKAMEMSARLLDLYARREVSARPPITTDDDLYREFEASFPFEETPDQAKAIEDIMSDLALERPMDRLVCGDVGFGKTEVAIRAAFKIAMDGRQIAVLVPTTVLAQQHYQSFCKRLDPYPINVAMVSRFRTTAQNNEVILGLKEGIVDIVIGTHRLLSKDVHFKRLGLLVIDEEHRFGVSHKERIRSLKASVDTMVLTATPIPRTLHMAFAGMRDLSLISTAPVDRRPIKTLICHDNPGLLKEAMERELARGGQVFFVHNRVKDIERTAQRVSQMMPNAKVAIGHGQMKENRLERVMLDFIAGRYDILVCTSIIESGIDISRANTIIIDRADTFGLAQLYQIRGRVGRSHVQAYAYLLVPPLATLGEDARERVEALTRHTELGSGFSLATLDLEIRGAGDLLGAEQSGEVSGVGFDMYCDLLSEATAELRGEPKLPEMEPEMTFEEPGFLPEDYISDVGQRLQYYKRLASAADENAVEVVAAELIDRFGSLPKEAGVIVEGMIAKAICRNLVIAGLEVSSQRITIHMAPDTKVDPDVVFQLIREGDGSIKLTTDLKLLINLPEGTSGGPSEAIRFLRRLTNCAIRIG